MGSDLTGQAPQPRRPTGSMVEAMACQCGSENIRIARTSRGMTYMVCLDCGHVWRIFGEVRRVYVIQ